jgi:hypothetical protein
MNHEMSEMQRQCEMAWGRVRELGRLEGVGVAVAFAIVWAVTYLIIR